MFRRLPHLVAARAPSWSACSRYGHRRVSSPQPPSLLTSWYDSCCPGTLLPNHDGYVRHHHHRRARRLTSSSVTTRHPSLATAPRVFFVERDPMTTGMRSCGHASLRDTPCVTFAARGSLCPWNKLAVACYLGTASVLEAAGPAPTRRTAFFRRAAAVDLTLRHASLAASREPATPAPCLRRPTGAARLDAQTPVVTRVAKSHFGHVPGAGARRRENLARSGTRHSCRLGSSCLPRRLTLLRAPAHRD